MKNYWLMVFVVAILATAMVSALPEVTWVKINGDIHEPGDNLLVQRGDTLNIRVKLNAENNTENNVEVDCAILGYEYSQYDSLSDATPIFDMDAGDTTYKDLTIKIPENVEKDYYDLRVRVGTRTGPAFEGLYSLHIIQPRHDVVIKDVILSPGSPIQAGKALLVIARIKNMGAKDEDGIKITTSIPELGVSGSEYIDKLDSGDSKSSEEIYLKLPACAKEGEYTLHTSISYADGYEDTSLDKTIVISAGELCTANATAPSEKSTIVVGSYSQTVARPGPGVSYPVLIENDGTSAQTYSVTVSNADDWATTQISPSSVLILSPGEAQTVYVYVVPKNTATEGQHMFNINVNAAGQTKQIPVSTIVSGKAAFASWESVKKWLITALVVLVIVLLILGIVLAFRKSKGKEEEKEEGQSYY